MDHDDFEKLVMEALDDLPDVFKRSLQNVEVFVESEPTPEEAGMVDARHRRMVMGLYQGVPLSRRTHYYGNVLPDRVIVFRKNIERVCRTDEEIKRLVVHTVRHELGHHFGISDDRMRQLGIY